MERVLYEYDPEGMGATVSAPLDEYSDAAVAVIRALRDRRPEAPLEATIRDVLPDATTELIAAIDEVWRELGLQ